MATEWRAELTFAERISATSKITLAYKRAHPTCTSSEASKRAKASEEGARKYASSLHEYHHMCSKAEESLLKSSSQTPKENQSIADSASQLTPTSGVQIGRYINAQHFRDGLFSDVFKAIDPEADSGTGISHLVALKVTIPEMMTPPHNAKREARLLQLAKGANIIELIETFQQPGSRFVLVFPFMPHDLSGLLRQRALDERSGRQILEDVFAGLAHIHQLGIIHRDIKPSNILLSHPNGPAYIADFGIAWAASDPESEPADEKILDVGTTCYRPPELLFGGQRYGAELDMWAAGCVVAQVFCLRSQSLFDAGDLGSELALIRSIFETLGTPDLEVWPVRYGVSEPWRGDWLTLRPGCRRPPGLGQDELQTVPGQALDGHLAGRF